MSIIDTCNRALSELGTQSTIASFDEISAEATQCRLWYDNQRQGLLRSAPWGFARRQVVLTLLGQLVDQTSPFPWLYKYAYPVDCLKFRYILAAPQALDPVVVPVVGVAVAGPNFLSPSRNNRWMIGSELDPVTGNERKYILSNVCAAIGVYTADVSDTDLFDTMFENALSASLAYKLVIPLSGNAGMREQFRASAEASIMNARVADGNEAIASTDHTADWITARGVGSVYGYGPSGSGAFGDWGNWYGGWENMNWGM